MNHKESQKVRIRIPMIFGFFALFFGIFGFLAEAFQWTGFFNWVQSNVFLQRILTFLARFENYFYRIVQMAQFEHDPDQYGNLVRNPFLFLARWLAPLALIWTAVSAYFQLRREASQLKKVTKWRDHTIVCGYGEIGKRIVQSLIDTGKKSVVIDPGIEKDHFEAHTKSNCILIRQDANIDTSLLRAGLARARNLMAVTGQDIINFSILANVRALLQDVKRKESLTAFAHVDNHELVFNVQDYPLFRLTEEFYDGRIFNGDDLAARLVFGRYAPDIFQPVVSVDNPPLHVLIIGFNAFGQSVVTHFARTAHFLNDVKTQVTVVDSNIKTVGDIYRGRYPVINQLIDLQLVSARPESLDQRIIDLFKNKQPVSVVYMCHDDTVVQALSLNKIRQLGKNKLHVVVCQSKTIPVPEWANIKNRIHIFDPFTEACTYETIVEEKLEQLAKSFHEYYLKEEKVRFNKKVVDYLAQKEKGLAGNDPKPKTSMVDWKQLTEEFKQSNRSLADHLSVKLRAIGCETRDKDDKKPEQDFPEDPNLINHLANMEHRRWNADRFLSGWRYGSKRDDSLKIHDNLVAWAELPDEIKEYDRNAIKNIPKILHSELFHQKICKI
ncbi:NAD-binding protein [candidate division KSB1 bacterium]|nr:NAD-binding protein [candidate division KSB1 bacterium]